LKVFAAAFRERSLLRWYVVIVVNMFMVGILFGFLPVYVNSLGYDQLRNGLIVGGEHGLLSVNPALSGAGC
jgi:hypothetical protein